MAESIALGTGDWVRIPGETGEIFITHVGPKLARRWTRWLGRLRREEADRARAKRRERVAEYGGSEDAARAADPVLWSDAWESGDEAIAEDSEKLFDEMVREAVTDIRNVEVMGRQLSGAEAARMRMGYLPPAAAFSLVLLILNQQSLTPRQLFPATGADDAQPESTADA